MSSLTARSATPSPASHGEHPFASRLAAQHARLLSLLDEAAVSDTRVVSAALASFMARKGKLLRPMLTLLCCEIAGGDPRQAVPLAAAVELVHCSSLILDDLPCMDNTDMRRGRASLHTRFGEAVAILTSVHLLSQAYRNVAMAKIVEPDLVGMLAEAISCNGMIRGQVLDLSDGCDSDEVRSMKTAPLFRVAAQFGAYAAHAPDWQVDALGRFAERLSLTFQVRDDIIDGDTASSQLQRAQEIGRTGAAELAATFGDTAPCRDLVRLIRFAVSREA